MTKFKVGDRVQVSIPNAGTFYNLYNGKRGTVTSVHDVAIAFPVDILLDDGRKIVVNHEELVRARPTAKEEIEKVKAQIKAILSAAEDGGGVPLAEARAKGIIEGLDVALAFIYEESLSEEDRKTLDAIDGGAGQW